MQNHTPNLDPAMRDLIQLQDAARAARSRYNTTRSTTEIQRAWEACDAAQRAYTAALFPLMAASGVGKRFYDHIEAARAALVREA